MHLYCFFLITVILGVWPSTSAAVRYVNVNGTNPTPPYTNWATAATVIQDAVDFALPGDEVTVTNGVYETGGRAVHEGMTNRVAVIKPIALRSVNGADVTVIRGFQLPGTTNGDGAVRCVYLTNGATLSGFTLTGGAVMGRVPLDPSGLPVFSWPLGAHELLSGGGVWCESLETVVSNCVLTANSAAYGGGAFSGTLNQCILIGNTAIATTLPFQSGGGGAVRSTLNDCTLMSNVAPRGGGAYYATLNRCSLSGNSAERGGGAFGCSLVGCTANGNTAIEAGGGTFGSTLLNCILVRNTARLGGGTYGGKINNCTITGNAALSEGGGAWAYHAGGGLRGCNTIGCYPQPECLGCVDDGSIMNNSIVFENTAPEGPNHFGFAGDGYTNLFGPKGGKMDYSCTTPLPDNGVGNITNAPMFIDALAGDFRLRPDSPSINAGLNDHAPNGTDFVGQPRIMGQRVDMGAYEFTPPMHYVDAGSTNPIPPYSTWATAATVIQDAVDFALPGDEVIVTNGVYETGGRAVHEGMTNRVAVTKPIILRSVNGADVTVIRGYQVPGTTNGDGAVRCVYLTNGAVLIGFTLTNGAVRERLPDDPWRWPLTGHEFVSGGGVWCESPDAIVSNCLLTGNSAVFGGGAFWGTLVHCQLIGNIAGSGGGAVRSSLKDSLLMGNSTSGPSTRYAGNVGGGAYNATLTRCVLSGNAAQRGGGVYGCMLTNCTVSGNTATKEGGGSRSSRLFNCVLVSNTAGLGGGAYGGEINNCTIVNNAASSGGGVWAFSTEGPSGRPRGCETIAVAPGPEGHGCLDDGAIVNNSIILNNTAPSGGNYAGFTGEGYTNSIGPLGGKLSYSCTTPMPINNIGNITNAPLFMDYLGGDFRLQSNSPCINAGRNAYTPAGPDLDGTLRIVGGTVDIGAYEFPLPRSSLSYAWLQQYGLSTDGSADFVDSDSDGQDNSQEWQAWTDPTNSQSALRLLSPVVSPNGLHVRWQSVIGQTYLLERSTKLVGPVPFVPLASNIVGQVGTTIFSDTSAASNQPVFYRVVVHE